MVIRAYSEVSCVWLPHPSNWSLRAVCNSAAAPPGREVLPSQQHWWCGESPVIYGHLIPLCPACNWCTSCLMEAHTEGNNSARNGSSDRGSHHR